jgi:Fic family protein
MYEMIDKKKSILDSARPLSKDLVLNLEDWFRIELTYTSNAIEGNTLTRQETALVVEKGLTVGGKSLSEHLEATNHAQALDWVKTQINKNSKLINENDILNIHNIILKGINDAIAGHYRNVSVRISGSTVILPNPKKVPKLMEEFILWLQNSNNLHPIELAAEAHYRLVTIHPFVDGNGRTARLLMNMILLMKGYPTAIIRKRDKLSYIKSLETAQLGGSKSNYMKLIAKAVERSLDIYLAAISGDSDDDQDKVKLLKIGELAKAVDETTSTIRHWTKEGLLEIEEVTNAGYQLYSSDMIERISLIKHLKAQRFTIKEIKEKIR